MAKGPKFSSAEDGRSQILLISPQTWEVLQPYFWFRQNKWECRKYVSGADGFVELVYLTRYLFRKWTRDYDRAEFEAVHEMLDFAAWKRIKVTAWDDYVDISYQPYFEMGQT